MIPKEVVNVLGQELCISILGLTKESVSKTYRLWIVSFNAFVELESV